jgi:acetate kinase
VTADDTASPVETLSDVDAAAVEAVAHRIVHSGPRFRDPVVIDARVEREIAALVVLAPLHNAPASSAMHEARAALPQVPHVAVFDTAFHATLLPEARIYALPRAYREDFGIRRYGFHGLSVAWASERVPVPRLVVCHLGGGCSVTAVREGRSVDTTMGFTPLEGVPMTTRAGSVDPGALLHLLRAGLASADELERVLELESGLLGLSGLSGSVGDLERSGAPEAAFALSLFAYRVAQAVAAMAVPLGGLDAIVFTAGIGERSIRVREEVCGRLRFLGVELDAEANRHADPDADVATSGSAVRVVVVRAREELVAAREARALLAALG